jgi:hypothetical protein
MSTAGIVEAGAHLKDVSEGFRRWRRKRVAGRDPIPENLWRDAAKLVGPMSCHAVARALGLDGAALKRQVRRLVARDRRAPRDGIGSRAPRFVEVRGVAGGTMQGWPDRGTAVEIERGDGARLRIFPMLGTPVDVSAVMDRFLGGGAARE